MLLSSELVLYKKKYVTVTKSMNIILKVYKKNKKNKNWVCYSVLPLVHFELLQMPGEFSSIQKSKHNLFYTF